MNLNKTKKNIAGILYLSLILSSIPANVSYAAAKPNQNVLSTAVEKNMYEVTKKSNLLKFDKNLFEADMVAMYSIDNGVINPDAEKCKDCRLCFPVCPDSSIVLKDGKMAGIDYDHCKGCGICCNVCPFGALEYVEGGQAE